MMGRLKRRDWQEYREAFFGKDLHSPCNMFIMRREVLETLCRWLFSLLFEVAEKGGAREGSYQNPLILNSGMGSRMKVLESEYSKCMNVRNIRGN